MAPLTTHMDGQGWMAQEGLARSTQSVELDAFLRGVERRALRMAELSVASRDEALDLVQDAMFGFTRH